MLDNTHNELFRCRTRNLVQVNDKSQGMYNKDNQIKFKTSMIRSHLCGLIIHAYLLVEHT